MRVGVAVDQQGPVELQQLAGMSRGQLLQTGAAGAALMLGLTAGSQLVRELGRVAGVGAPPMARSSFTPHVGSVFQIRPAGAAPVPVRLTEIGNVSRMPGHDDAFSLLFTANRGSAPLTGGIHTLRHPQLGRMSLYLEPVGRGAMVRDYEAIINRVPGR
jgi:hypothetical protein